MPNSQNPKYLMLQFMEGVLPKSANLRLVDIVRKGKKKFAKIPGGTELLFDMLISLVTLFEAAFESDDEGIKSLPSGLLLPALLIPACGWAFSEWERKFPDEDPRQVLVVLLRICRDPYQIGSNMYNVRPDDIRLHPSPFPEEKLDLILENGKIVLVYH